MSYNLNGYRYIKHLGSGGTGEVHLYEKECSGEKVAVKFCPKAGVNPITIERFHREYETLKEMQHPNIIKVYEYMETNDYIAIIMEYMDQGALERHMFKEDGETLKTWPLDSVLAFMIQVVDGLKQIHEKELMHRDIKPSNILLEDNVFKISDFGSIKTRDSLLTVTAKVPITVIYAAPELWEDASHKIFDYSCDIYSLGLICYKMLTGRHPFVGLAGYAAGKFTPIRNIRNEVPITMAAIVEKMMHVRSEQRYTSAKNLFNALEDLNTRWENLNTQDPLFELAEILRVKTSSYDSPNDSFWPKEQETARPSRQEIQIVSKIIALNKTMAPSRREISENLLLKFYLCCGNWQESAQLASEMHPNHLATKYLNTIKQRSAKMDREKYYKLRQCLAQSMWPEKSFYCKRTKKTFSLNDLQEKNAFLIRNEAIDKTLLVKNARKKLLGYKIVPSSTEKDVLGQYYLAFNEDASETFIFHALPFERDKFTKHTQQIIERYKRGIRHAYEMKDAPCLVAQGNINPIEDESHTYFILEYRPLKRLPFLIAQQKQASASGGNIFVILEIARGLEVMFSCAAVHRYLSPLRIEIDILGNVSIAGFSFAKLTEGNISDDWINLSMDMSNQRLGNPYYMSPEEFEDGLNASSHRSDIWSFGAIAYKLLTGKNVFDVETNEIATFRNSKPPIIPLKEHLPDISESLASIIEKCLEYNCEKRYENASMLVNDLLVYINNELVV